MEGWVWSDAEVNPADAETGDDMRNDFRNILVNPDLLVIYLPLRMNFCEYNVHAYGGDRLQVARVRETQVAQVAAPNLNLNATVVMDSNI